MRVSRRRLLVGTLGTVSIAGVATGWVPAYAESPTGADIRTASSKPEPLGQPLRDVNLIGAAVSTASDGTPMIHGVLNGRPSAHLVSVHAGTGEVQWSHELPGASGAYAVLVDPDGDVYVGSTGNGSLYRKPSGVDRVDELGQPLAGQSFLWDIDLAPDGLIYGVTYPGARLFAFDPATEEVRDFGRVAEDTQQARTVEWHDGQVYVGTMTAAHLLRVDPDSAAITEIPLPAEANPDDPLTSIFDIDAAGGVLYVRVGADIKYAPLFPYDPAKDSWGTPISDVAGLALPSPGPSGELYVMRENTLVAYDPASGDLTPTSLRYPGRVFNYRGVGWVELNQDDWPGRTLTGFFWRGEVWRYNPQTGRSQILEPQVEGSPVEILSLESAAEGGVWAGGFLAGFALVDADSGDADFNIWSQTESMHDDGRYLWLGAYPDARGYRYDPQLPFNDPDYNPGPPDTAVNPVKLWDHKELEKFQQDRVFAIAHADGVTAGATGPKGTSFGGTLTFWFADSGQLRVVQPAENRALTSLAIADGVVYAGSWVNGGTGSGTPPETEGTVLAYHIAEDRVLWQVSPVEGEPSYVGARLDAAGRLWTLAGTTLVRMDPADGAVQTRVTLPGEVDSIGMTFPHSAGMVRLVPSLDALLVKVAGRLFRVPLDPTGPQDYEEVGEFPYDLFTALPDGTLLMADQATLFRWNPLAG